MSEDIRIYVADLAAYNNGKLHGVWVDACADLDEIWNAVNAMLKASPEPGPEEWAIHDYEGFDAKKAVEESYSGLYTSLASYAEELTDNTADIPQNLAYYLDYERMGRDMELSSDIYTIETAHDEVHVFWSQ